MHRQDIVVPEMVWLKLTTKLPPLVSNPAYADQPAW
jgi:hypothetical protein